MTTNRIFLLLMLGVFLMINFSCKKKDSMHATVSSLTTASITNITATSATSGGTIIGNGGADITASGIAWSKTNTMPTIADDTTKGTTTSGSFVSELKNLDPSATYYVRAYATNSVGTGYGNVQTFGSGNAAPEAKNVNITGNKQVGAVLTANYTYFDAESNPESATAFQWYIANDTIGAAVMPIAGATANAYTVASSNLTRYIKVGITPKSSVGASPGIESKSYWVGPIGAETVTFTYNGQTVSYGVITSAVTGKKWLDRNLGALQVADSAKDYRAYGDLIQWGRPLDGHQLIVWTASDNSIGAPGAPVYGKTSILSTTDSPGHPDFITGFNDWRSPSNDNLIQINNPCPAGWHIPTNAEWDAENISYIFDATFNQLKLTAAGDRRNNNGNLEFQGGRGLYRSSTLTSAPFGFVYTFRDAVSTSPVQTAPPRTYGYSCRCIKN